MKLKKLNITQVLCKSVQINIKTKKQKSLILFNITQYKRIKFPENTPKAWVLSCSYSPELIYCSVWLHYSLCICVPSFVLLSPSSPLHSHHRDLPQKPSAEAQACVSWLAHLMVRIQEESSLISPWSLMACLLLQAPATVLSKEGLPWHQLTEKTLWLRKLALDFGARLNWPGGYGDGWI